MTYTSAHNYQCQAATIVRQSIVTSCVHPFCSAIHVSQRFGYEGLDPLRSSYHLWVGTDTPKASTRTNDTLRVNSNMLCVCVCVCVCVYAREIYGYRRVYLTHHVLYSTVRTITSSSTLNLLFVCSLKSSSTFPLNLAQSVLSLSTFLSCRVTSSDRLVLSSFFFISLCLSESSLYQSTSLPIGFLLFIFSLTALSSLMPPHRSSINLSSLTPSAQWTLLPLLSKNSTLCYHNSSMYSLVWLKFNSCTHEWCLLPTMSKPPRLSYTTLSSTTLLSAR